MKILFFLLLLANVVVFMWEYRQGAFWTAPATPDESQADYNERIVLLSEIDNNQETDAETRMPTLDTEQVSSPAAETESTAPKTEPEPNVSVAESEPDTSADSGKADDEPNASGPVCYQAGPFSNQTIYRIWQKQLSGSILAVDKEVPIVKDYMVYYPAAETLNESKDNVQMLKENGLNDLYMINQGEDQGVISLGVYASEDKAIQLKNELLAKEINTEIKARYKNKRQTFAFIQGEKQTIDVLDSLKQQYPAINVKQAEDADAENCLSVN